MFCCAFALHQWKKCTCCNCLLMCTSHFGCYPEHKWPHIWLDAQRILVNSDLVSLLNLLLFLATYRALMLEGDGLVWGCALRPAAFLCSLLHNSPASERAAGMEQCAVCDREDLLYSLLLTHSRIRDLPRCHFIHIYCDVAQKSAHWCSDTFDHVGLL